MQAPDRDIEQQMLSPAEVATYLGIGRTKVYEILNADNPNRLKNYKIGRRRVISQVHLDEWLRTQLYDPENEIETYNTW